jgi:Protein of unknown function (DUF3048) N-terminal domain/Protein of unknown function (DUF3048) C-terminal domain
VIQAVRRVPRPALSAGVVLIVAAVVIVAVLAIRPGTSSAPIVADASPVPTSRPTAPPTPSPVPVSPSPSPSAAPSATPSAGPTYAPGIADLTGLRVPNRLAHRLPIAVLIDDNRVARPQSGFNGASIVYQAPADGGETRYMLVFQEGDSADVGPVRSGRGYFIHWASETRAAIAHYGGDRITRAALQLYDGKRYTDIDALRTTARPFHRIKSRSAPHNAYTSTARLRAVIPALGGPALMPVGLARRPFADPVPLAVRPARQTIRIPYRTGVVGYVYDRGRDDYRRLLDGRTQVDPADGKAVRTRNVVVLFMGFHTDSTIERGHARPVLAALGSGKALIFREGRVIVGTWRKPGGTALLRLFDRTGKEIPLVRGRTFFQAVPSGTSVTPAG